MKSIFQEMISMDTLIVQIMNQAQKLVNADRTSLFLVDSKTKQLYARFEWCFRDFLLKSLILYCEEYLMFLAEWYLRSSKLHRMLGKKIEGFLNSYTSYSSYPHTYLLKGFPLVKGLLVSWPTLHRLWMLTELTRTRDLTPPLTSRLVTKPSPSFVCPSS